MKNGSKMEQNNQEQKVKEKKGGFKKFLKITGFVMLGIVGMVVVAMGVAFITGAYSKDKINILSLSTSAENMFATESPVVYIGDGSAEIVVMAGDTLTTTLSFTPDNANQKHLLVKYINGKNLLKETPETVVAGEKFSLKFKENVGGEVEIKFTNSTKLVNFTLKVLVDNIVTDNDLTFSVDQNSGFKEVEKKTNDNPTSSLLTGSDKRFVTARDGDNTKYITLQGKTANTVAPKRGAVVFNDSTISTLSYKTPYTVINTDENRLVLFNDQNTNVKNSDGTMEYRYAMRAMSSTTNAYISTYFPKTFAMQLDFNTDWLNKAIDNNLIDYDYVGLNEYINKYFDYIYPVPNSVDKDGVQAYLDTILDGKLIKDAETGLYSVIIDDENEQSRLASIMQDIFIYAKQDIVVYDVEIGKINVQENLSYKLFSSSTYNNDTIGDGEGIGYLGATLISKSLTDIDNSLLKEDIGKMTVAPYSKINEENLGSWEKNTAISVPAETLTYNWLEVEKADQTSDIDISSGPKVVASDGREYLQFVRIGDEWYRFDETKLQVKTTYTVDGYKKVSTWQFDALNPTITTDNLALIYSIESINEDGESNWVFAKSNVSIDYTRPTIFGYSQNEQTKMIYHHTPNSASAELSDLKNTTGYKINSLTLNVNDVISNTALADLEYKTVRFFMVKATNTFTYNGIDYNVFEVNDAWQTCTLYNLDGTQITVGEYREFYDLGSNPTLNILNITSLNIDDPASKVKIFACIMQSDVDGNQVCEIEYDENDPTIVVSRAYSVVHYSSTDGYVNTNNITIDHFASKLFAYVNLGDDYVMGSSSAIENISTADTLNVYISAYELSADGTVDDGVSDVDGKSVDSDGICLTYLNKQALKNYYNLSSGLLKNDIAYAEGMPAFDSVNMAIGSVVNTVTQSNIEFDFDNDLYITISLTFNSLADKIEEGYLTVGSVDYATSDRPLELDFMVYIVPDGEIGTNTPYYDITGFDAYCKTHIKLVQSNDANTTPEGAVTPEGSESGNTEP